MQEEDYGLIGIMATEELNSAVKDAAIGGKLVALLARVRGVKHGRRRVAARPRHAQQVTVKRSQDVTVKSSFNVTDDLEHVTTLSYTSRIPLNDRNRARSTSSLHPQHGDDPPKRRSAGKKIRNRFTSTHTHRINTSNINNIIIIIVAQAGIYLGELANLMKLTSSSTPEMQ
jgi:hypothetical protein